MEKSSKTSSQLYNAASSARGAPFPLSAAKKSPNLLAEGNVIHMLTLTGSEIESFLEATYISPQES